MNIMALNIKSFAFPLACPKYSEGNPTKQTNRILVRALNTCSLSWNSVWRFRDTHSWWIVRPSIVPCKANNGAIYIAWSKPDKHDPSVYMGRPNISRDSIDTVYSIGETIVMVDNRTIFRTTNSIMGIMESMTFTWTRRQRFALLPSVREEKKKDKNEKSMQIRTRLLRTQKHE